MIEGVNIDAEIIPGYSLGGLSLRTHVSEIESLIIGLGSWKQGSCLLLPPYEARYVLGKGEIQIAIDVRNGGIFKLIAGDGYAGKLFGKIQVGMLVRDAVLIDPRIQYDEGEEALVFRGVTGVVMDLPEVDPDPNRVPELFIDTISVFVGELDTIEGQRGHWQQAFSR